jgi:hypothetical protein
MNGPKLTLAALLALSVAGAARRGSAARDTSGSWALKRDDAWQRRVTEEVHAHWSRRGIDGWTPELDPSDGSLSWSHPEADVIVYATPFFGDPGADGFGVLLVSEDGLDVYDSLDVDLPYGPGYAESYGRVMRPILDNVTRGARFG